MFILACCCNGESSAHLPFSIGHPFRTSKELSDDKKSEVCVVPAVHRVEGTACS